ncbi:MAG: cytochrome c [Bacteroidota bacterium]|nr:cytochrome c [Bacteroidota bacterium]
MKNFDHIYLVFIVCLGVYACAPAGGNNTGHEYMPDMAHSVAYEANIDNYYFYHTWDSKEVYRNYSIPKLPVKGSIPRGFAGASATDSSSKATFAALMDGSMSNNAIRVVGNGFVPYYYKDTEDERNRAMREIISNPMPISKAGLERGKNLYTIYCGICHGEQGDGAGYLVRDGGAYPAQPANFLKDEFIAATEGRYYHSIMHGKNVMGAYSDKLSFQERWEVIHHIRSLQAVSKKLVYSEVENTFTGSQALLDAKKASASLAQTTAITVTK